MKRAKTSHRERKKETCVAYEMTVVQLPPSFPFSSYTPSIVQPRSAPLNDSLADLLSLHLPTLLHNTPLRMLSISHIIPSPRWRYIVRIDLLVMLRLLRTSSMDRLGLERSVNGTRPTTDGAVEDVFGS